MMPHALQTDPQPMLKAWALQHCRNEIQRAILFHAPDHFTWEDCNAVEALMMAEFERWIAHLTAELLKNVRYMNSLIEQIVADTVALLRSRRPFKG
ncbi:MAG: hypothetical protein ABSH56_15080 [Bryobacteraceae bacterium]